MNKEEYKKYAETKAPPSSLVKNMLMAFVVGGIICVLGEIISVYFRTRGFTVEQGGAATTIIMIFLGGLLTGLGLYDDIAKYAGAGTIVPITGFANSIVSPAIEFKSEGLVMGIGAKMFVIAGPVLVYGTLSSVLAGIIYFLLK